MRAILGGEYSPIGLDVGHDSVKMLQLCRRGAQSNWRVSAGGIYPFSDAVRQNPAQRWRQVSTAVRSLMAGPARAGFHGRKVVAALDHQQVLVKNARLPKMPASELAEALKWEAAERIPFDLTGGLVHHLVAGDVRQGGEQRQEVLLFAVEEKTLRETLESLDAAAVSPVGLDAQSLALARSAECFLPADSDPDSVSALVDLGSASCQVLIRRGGRTVFVKTIEIGSADMTRAVVEKVGGTPEDAASMRSRLGAPGGQDSSDENSKVARVVASAMRPVVERLAQEISLCLRYYSVTFRGRRPDAVTVVGGAAHDQAVLRLLGEAMGLNVQAGKPLAGMSASDAVCQWGGGVDAGGPEWAVALGCCLKPPLDRRTPQGAEVADGQETAESAAAALGEPQLAAVAADASTGQVTESSKPVADRLGSR
jgi:type IV pilus assembly protein PilM